jgi:cytochrome P450
MKVTVLSTEFNITLISLSNLLPKNREPPKDRKKTRHLEQVAGQLLVAGYETSALWFYFTIYYLLKNSGALETLTKETRSAFKNYDEISLGSAAQLAYRTACLNESLRIMPGVHTGMPVVSLDARVDGAFIPKGVSHLRVWIIFIYSNYYFSTPGGLPI